MQLRPKYFAQCSFERTKFNVAVQDRFYWCSPLMYVRFFQCYQCYTMWWIVFVSWFLRCSPILKVHANKLNVEICCCLHPQRQVPFRHPPSHDRTQVAWREIHGYALSRVSVRFTASKIAIQKTRSKMKGKTGSRQRKSLISRVCVPNKTNQMIRTIQTKKYFLNSGCFGVAPNKQTKKWRKQYINQIISSFLTFWNWSLSFLCRILLTYTVSWVLNPRAIIKTGRLPFLFLCGNVFWVHIGEFSKYRL